MSESTTDENKELKRQIYYKVKRLRAYYINLIVFFFAVAIYVFSQYYPFSNHHWLYWGLVFWGIVLMAKGLSFIDGFWIFSSSWEEDKAQKLLEEALKQQSDS